MTGSRLAVLVSLAGLVAPAVCPALDAKVRVTADRVNLRAAAEPEAEVVAQVSEGEILVVRGGPTGEWVAVEPPPRVDLWVYGDMVRDGIVSVARLRVRSGPGINYRPVGQLDRGDTVDVRAQVGDWLKVGPPRGTSLYIHSRYVSPVPPPSPPAAKRVNERPVAAVAPPAVAAGPPSPPGPVAPRTDEPARVAAGTAAAGTGTPAQGAEQEHRGAVATRPPTPAAAEPPPFALAGRELAISRAQGRPARHEGALRRVGFLWRRPSKFRLVGGAGNRSSETVCYVLGNEQQLESLLGKDLTIQGREYFVEGLRYPVVIPERIVRRE
jgi:uncharacterized protein YgiM (DUF1202 family)